MRTVKAISFVCLCLLTRRLLAITSVQGMTPDTSTVPQTRKDPSELKIETILVPLDFSPASLGGLDYAVWLAKQFRAAIHLVHVYPPDEASSVPGAAHLLLQSAEAINALTRN